MEQTRKPLLVNHTSTDCNRLRDLLYAFAKNIENSLIEAGAIPGKDYTIHDLYGWAVPLAVEWIKNIAKDKDDKRWDDFSFDTEF